MDKLMQLVFFEFYEIILLDFVSLHNQLITFYNLFGSPDLEPDLQHPLGQPGLLGQLLQILGIRIVVQAEVCLHGAQL